MRGIQNWKEADIFLTFLYNYHIHGGARNFLLSKIGFLIKYGLTVSFIFFFGEMIDFVGLHRALTAPQKETLNLSDFIVFDLSNISFMMALVYLLTCMYGIFLVYSEMVNVKKMFSIGDIVRNKLKMSLQDICITEWATVCIKVIPLLDNHFPLSSTWTELDITNHIMRRENYLLALVHMHAFQYSKAWEWNPLVFVSLTTKNNEKRKHPILTKTLEWALRLGLFAYIFDVKTGTIRTDIMDPTNRKHATKILQWRFRVMAIVGFILSPFVALILLIDFLLENGEQFRNRSQPVEKNKFQVQLMDRTWSNEARWVFRAFNELPHYFHQRLVKANDASQQYLGMFTSPTTGLISRIVFYVCAAFVTFILTITFWGNDDFLTRVNVLWQRSGLFWLTLCSAILTVAKSFLPPEFHENNFNGVLKEIQKHVHHFPKEWLHNEHLWEVRDQFSRYYEYKWYQCVLEFMSVLYCPFLLWFFLPQKAELLIRFFGEHSVQNEHGQWVCSYSDFATKVSKLPKTAKMDTSIRLFHSAYPNFATAEKLGKTQNISGSFSSNNDSSVDLENSITEILEPTELIDSGGEEDCQGDIGGINKSWNEEFKE